MKLHLKNFRIYEDKKFDLGESGITLIAGKSGQGKSTILLAITFALYGVGTKLQTNGKKSCSVTLEVNDLKIYRSKCPNKIVVTKLIDNIEYENDSAECIIKEKFGNNLVSYIPQNMQESFIHMTPMTRLAFLEKFAFGDIDIIAVKSKIKALIKTYEDKHTSSKANLELLTNLLSEIKKPEKVDFPIVNEKPTKETISSHKAILKEICNTQERLEVELKQLNIIKIDCIKRDGKLGELLHRQTECESQLENKKIIFNSITETNKDLKISENKLESLLKYKEYLRVKTDCDKSATLIENIKNEEIKIMTDEIQKMKEDFNLKNSSFLQEDEAIEEQAEELEKMEQQLANHILNKEYNLLKEQYDCDVKKCCEMKENEMKNIALKLENLRNYILLSGDMSSEISDTSELISFLLKKKEIETHLSSLKEILNPSEQLLKIEGEINSLEQQKLRKVVYTCPHCKQHTRFVNNKLICLDKPLLGEMSNETEDQISSKLSKAKSIKIKLLNQQEEYSKFTILRDDLNFQLQSQKSWLEEFDNPESKTILEWTTELNQLKKAQEDYNFNKRKIFDLETQFEKKLYSETIVSFELGVNKLKKKLETYNIPSEKCQVNEKQLRQNISNLHQEIEDFFKLKKECCEIQLKITTLQVKITKGVFSNTVSNLQIQLEKDLEVLSKLKDDFSHNIQETPDDIRTEIYNLKSKLEKKNFLILEIATIEKELMNILENKNTLSNVNNYTLDDIVNKITSQELLIDGCKKDYREKEDLVKKMDEWKLYALDYKKWKDMKERFDLNKKEENILRKQNEALIILRDKTLETQSISISNLIDTINTHAQIFLDKFFTDNPISVKISSFKESKNGDKPCINLEIDYRGIEHDLSMLSGGEMSRVTLAFTLALSEIHNSPLIMLDESTASLDQECVCDVIEGLKDTFGDKLVLLIAHQVVKGVFDKTIEL